MITLAAAGDIDFESVRAVAFADEPLALAPALLEQVKQGRQRFLALIERGVPCYGVTTGLGHLVQTELDDAARGQLASNILRARATAVGEALPRAVARGTLMIKLVNFLSARDGVSADLCCYLVARLNDDFTPWIPRLGHGMGGDAVAHSHCFQTFIGEGFVLGAGGEKRPAGLALQDRGVAPYVPRDKEGLALISGTGASVAYAIHVYLTVARWLERALLVTVTAMEAMAAPRDCVDPALAEVTVRPGTLAVLRLLHGYLADSTIKAHRLQAPVSFRIGPQVYGALYDALGRFRAEIEQALGTFTDNPVLADTGGETRLLSFGGFHDQHLLNEAEHLAVALLHAGALSERRMHRLMDPTQTGLSPQLAERPGLDAGLVTTQKAVVELMSRAKLLGHPSSLYTAETSAGQEDYMALIFPVLDRLLELSARLTTTLCYELLVTTTAVRLRGQPPGSLTRQLLDALGPRLAAPGPDRPPGPDVEVLESWVAEGALEALVDSPAL